MADISIYGAIRAMTGDGKSAYATQVYDDTLSKFQSEINQSIPKDGDYLSPITKEEFDAIFT